MNNNNTTPAMKKKITSSEYQALPIQLKNRYTRYSGSDEVYYELVGIAPAMKEFETLEQKAATEFMRRVVKEISDLGLDNTTENIEEFYDKGKFAYFIKGAQWREENPVKGEENDVATAWDMHSRAMPEDTYDVEQEYAYVAGKSIMLEQDFKDAVAALPPTPKQDKEWVKDTRLMNGIDSENIVVLFDNGEKRFYNDDWPFAEAIAWFELPPSPNI